MVKEPSTPLANNSVFNIILYQRVGGELSCPITLSSHLTVTTILLLHSILNRPTFQWFKTWLKTCSEADRENCCCSEFLCIYSYDKTKNYSSHCHRSFPYIYSPTICCRPKTPSESTHLSIRSKPFKKKQQSSARKYCKKHIPYRHL